VLIYTNLYFQHNYHNYVSQKIRIFLTITNPRQENRSPVLITYNLANRFFMRKLSESWDKKRFVCVHTMLCSEMCVIWMFVFVHIMWCSVRFILNSLHILHILNVFVKWLNVCSEIVNLLWKHVSFIAPFCFF